MNPVTFIVVPAVIKMTASAVILGVELIKSNQIGISMTQHHLAIHREEAEIYLYITGVGNLIERVLRRLTCYTAASINVAANETVEDPITWELSIIHNSVDCSDLLYIEDVVPPKIWKQFKCLSGLVGVKVGRLSVLVMNCVPSKQHLPKKITISNLSTVVETEVSEQQELWTLEKLQEMVPIPSLCSVQKDEVYKLLMQQGRTQYLG